MEDWNGPLTVIGLGCPALDVGDAGRVVCSVMIARGDLTRVSWVVLVRAHPPGADHRRLPTGGGDARRHASGMQPARTDRV